MANKSAHGGNSLPVKGTKTTKYLHTRKKNDSIMKPSEHYYKLTLNLSGYTVEITAVQWTVSTQIWLSKSLFRHSVQPNLPK